MGFCRQDYWSGLPCPPPGNLPHPGIEPTSLRSPALVGRFFTTSAAWEAHSCYTAYQCNQVKTEIILVSFLCRRKTLSKMKTANILCFCVWERETEKDWECLMAWKRYGWYPHGGIKRQRLFWDHHRIVLGENGSKLKMLKSNIIFEITCDLLL